VTVPVTAVTTNPLNIEHLQKSDSCDSENMQVSSLKSNKRMTGLQVIRLVEEAGGDLSLRDDGTLRWSFPDILVGTTRERELLSLLAIHGPEVRHVLRVNTRHFPLRSNRELSNKKEIKR
jgi:hypothetical protein